jgi:hypothetical protein
MAITGFSAVHCRLEAAPAESGTAKGEEARKVEGENSITMVVLNTALGKLEVKSSRYTCKEHAGIHIKLEERNLVHDYQHPIQPSIIITHHIITRTNPAVTKPTASLSLHPQFLPRLRPHPH